MWRAWERSLSRADEEEADVARRGEVIVVCRGGGGECDTGEEEVSVARREKEVSVALGRRECGAPGR